MTREEVRALVREKLASVAPDADLDALAPDADLRESIDLDSVDFLRFVTALHAATGVSIPNADYRQICTLRGCVDYLSSRISSSAPTRSEAS